MITTIDILQAEATANQYIFNFVLMNIVFFLCCIFRNDRKEHTITWLLFLVFCLYAYWGSDYFSFRAEVFSPDFKNFRDPLYYYLKLISFDSYTIFRLFVWGGAMLFYAKSLDNFKIPLNISIFIFAVFYLLTFSFGRISLGACLYFYGLSLLLSVERRNVLNRVIGIIFIVCSYWGHRAMILPIVLTPLIILKPNRIQVAAIIVIGLIAGRSMAPFLSELIAGDIELGTNLAAEEALLGYASVEIEEVMNWKFELTSKLRWYSIYILLAYCVWKCFYSKYRNVVPMNIKRLIVVCLGIFLIAFSLQQIDKLGPSEMGERFLFILGVPLTMILAFLRKENYCSQKTMFLLLFLAFVYAEGFIFGKILSFY